VINTYGSAADTAADARVSHTRATRLCNPMKRESSTGGQQLAREIFHSAVSPFRLPFADPLIWPSSLPRVVSLRTTLEGGTERDNGEWKRERKRERERERGGRESECRGNHANGSRLAAPTVYDRPTAICNSMIRIYGSEEIRRDWNRSVTSADEEAAVLEINSSAFYRSLLLSFPLSCLEGHRGVNRSSCGTMGLMEVFKQHYANEMSNFMFFSYQMTRCGLVMAWMRASNVKRTIEIRYTGIRRERTD